MKYSFFVILICLVSCATKNVSNEWVADGKTIEATSKDHRECKRKTEEATKPKFRSNDPAYRLIENSEDIRRNLEIKRKLVELCMKDKGYVKAR